MPGSPGKQAQIERILRSARFVHAEVLSQLLRYLADAAIKQPDSALKEYQIAVEALGRREDFDGRLDSAVRVQTSRLRAKLAEYYADEGANDPIIVELNRGSYSLVFRERAARETTAPSTRDPRRTYWIAAALVSGILLGGMGSRLLWHSEVDGHRPEAKWFWTSLIPPGPSPLLIYSNAAFVGNPSTGMRYFRMGEDAQKDIVAAYTGVGELIAVHGLDDAFSSIRRKLEVKRARLVNWEDIRNRDLIVVGPPIEIPLLRNLPERRHFEFQAVPEGHTGAGVQAILNRHPRAGEQSFYVPAQNPPFSEDFAVVEMVENTSTGRRILLLAGTQTFGTQAAAEFICREEHLANLRRSLGGKLVPFAALLRVKADGGIPIQTRMEVFRQGSAK